MWPFELGFPAMQLKFNKSSVLEEQLLGSKYLGLLICNLKIDQIIDKF